MRGEKRRWAGRCEPQAAGARRHAGVVERRRQTADMQLLLLLLGVDMRMRPVRLLLHHVGPEEGTRGTRQPGVRRGGRVVRWDTPTPPPPPPPPDRKSGG